MNCERARELFSSYTENDLDKTISVLVWEHFKCCTACKREYDLFKQTWIVLGSMPEAKVPSNLRHDVLMRMARVQHQQRQTVRPIIPTLDLDYIVKRFFPPKAVALGLAAVLALVLLRVPETTYHFVSSKLNASIVPSIETPKPATNMSVDSTPLEQSQKVLWQNRKLGRNSVWMKIDREERGDGMALYLITLSINRAALLSGDNAARIGARVYLLPPGQSNPNDLTTARLLWDVNILREPGVQLPFNVNTSQESGGVETLVIDWKFRGRNHAQVVYLPTQKQSSFGDTLDLKMTRNSSEADNTVYSTLKNMATEYGVPIVANAKLDEKPSVINLGQGSIDQALRNSLEPLKLDWLCSDKAVYVDRKYDVPASIE